MRSPDDYLGLQAAVFAANEYIPVNFKMLAISEEWELLLLEKFESNGWYFQSFSNMSLLHESTYILDLKHYTYWEHVSGSRLKKTFKIS